MANYQTQLKDWGVSGAEYPNSYRYEDNKPPVDAWDNFLMDNIITDIQHLLTLTNKRIESDKQTSKPASPEPGHLFYNTDTGSYYWYDATTASWDRVLDATGDSMSGTLEANAGVKVDSNISDSASNIIYDFANSHVPSEIVEKDGLNADLLDGKTRQEISTAVLEDGSTVVDPVLEINFDKDFNVTDTGGGTVNVDAETIPNTHIDIEDNGNQVRQDPPNLNFKGHLNAYHGGNGDVAVDPSHNHDSRYYTQSEVQSWVNNNADVPNADHANTVGTVDDNGHTLYLQDNEPNNPNYGDIWIDTS